MSFYKKQEFDFIQRTKKIIEQYDSIHFENSNEKFEKTLFINCLLGLLIIPQQYWFDNLPDTKTNNSWGILESEINFIVEDNKSVKNITRHLRNSISHYTFQIIANKSNEIEKIKFTDLDIKKKLKSFEANINIDNLKKFTYNLTDFLTAEINRQK